MTGPLVEFVLACAAFAMDECLTSIQPDTPYLPPPVMIQWNQVAMSNNVAQPSFVADALVVSGGSGVCLRCGARLLLLCVRALAPPQRAALHSRGACPAAKQSP